MLQKEVLVIVTIFTVFETAVSKRKQFRSGGAIGICAKHGKFFRRLHQLV